MKSELGKNHSTDIGEIPISNISLLKKKEKKRKNEVRYFDLSSLPHF